MQRTRDSRDSMVLTGGIVEIRHLCDEEDVKKMEENEHDELVTLSPQKGAVYITIFPQETQGISHSSKRPLK